MDTMSERPSGRHQISIGHLVMGLAFLGIVVRVLARAAGVVR